MFDTMTFTKVVGGFCGAFLVFLLGKWAAEEVYHVGETGHGEEHAAAWVIETDEGEGEGGGEEQPVDYATLWQSADPDAGERVFNACRACHKLDGNNAVGPHLDGVVGRPVDSVSDFSYSGALEEAADTWTVENLFHFLENPQGYAPGTAMSFSGLSDPEDRINVIAFLNTHGGNADVPEASGGGDEGASAEGSGEEAASGEGSGDEAAAESEGGGDEAAAQTEGGDEAQAEGEDSGDAAQAGGSDEAQAEGGDDSAQAEGEGSEDSAQAEGDDGAQAEGEGSEETAQAEGGDEAQAESEGGDEAAAEGEGESQQAASSEGGEASGGDPEFVAAMENADASAGEKTFNKCRACHKIDGTNGVGPHLDGVVGRKVDSVEDFNYSGALEEVVDVWTKENLFHFLEAPRQYAPGTKMTFAGLRKPEERANVIAYLESLGN